MLLWQDDSSSAVCGVVVEFRRTLQSAVAASASGGWDTVAISLSFRVYVSVSRARGVLCLLMPHKPFRVYRRRP